MAQTLDRLRDLGALDDTLLVVTADHGISFRPGEPLRSVSVANHTDIMWTPLFVHAPGQSNGTVDDRPARSIDVLPTMLELLDAETDVALDGRSLLGPPPNDDGDVRRLYQSGLTAFEPADVLRPPAGRDHLEFDGAAGFATVLATPGLPADGDPALRIYRIGEHGDLVGRSVAPLLDDRPSDHAASIVDRAERFANVDPRARTIPWVYNQVFFNGSTDPETIALLDQGIVIAVGRTAMLDADGHAFAMLLVPPALMLPGEHRLTVAIVRGSPDAPTLDPVLTG